MTPPLTPPQPHHPPKRPASDRETSLRAKELPQQIRYHIFKCSPCKTQPKQLIEARLA